MRDETEDARPSRWNFLPHSKTHRLLVVVVLIVVVAIMLRIAS